MKPLLACLLLSGLAARSLAQAPVMQPFEMVWKAAPDVVADMSFLLEAPAGRDGFITVRDGHLVKGNGQRQRLWGVNFSFVASLPDKENAPLVAAHLARFGINCVRIHHLDWRTPRGIIDSRYPDSRHLDPEKHDRLDFLVSELKKRGIYVNLNLNVARAFQEADGVRDAKLLGFAKAVTFFDPRIVELEKEYATQMLTHRNPYTGLEYRNDPAVAIVEIVNENSLVESWVRGRLEGKGPDPKQADQTWSDIPKSYAEYLDGRYAAWLTQQPGKPEWPRLKAAEIAGADAKRFAAEAAFYMELERKFFLEMRGHLKETLGVKVPVIATSIHAGGLSAYPLLSSTSQLDVVDTHVYWQHPRYFNDAATGRRGFEIQNTPMVNQPEKSTVVTLNRSSMVGKPFAVTEVNHPYPNEYGAEGLPILAAYGAFQDWDAIFWYSFEHSEAANWISKYPSHFDTRQDPVKMTQIAAAGAMFLRGDVSVAKEIHVRDFAAAQVRESLRMKNSETPNYAPGMPATLALRTGSRVGKLDAAGGGTATYPAVTGPVVSDTKELQWLVSPAGQGTVSVDTARTQALIGFGKANTVTLRHLAPNLTTDFVAVMLVSLDGRAIAESSRMLLTTGARTGNTGMVWNAQRTSLMETGSGPMTIEPVTGTITLKALRSAMGVTVQALDGAGQKLGPALKATRNKEGWQFPVGKTVTPWYQLEVTRAATVSERRGTR